jgi:uncharacterized protein
VTANPRRSGAISSGAGTSSCSRLVVWVRRSSWNGYARKASASRFALVLDVEGYRHEKDFFRHLCASIQEEIQVGQAVINALTERLKRLYKGSDSLQGDWRNLLLDLDWQVFADHLLAQLEAHNDGKTWLILVDEITIFTKAVLDDQGVKAASDFLYKLRNLCRQHKQVRWLFTGSIGLDTIARRNGFEGALVDLEIFALQPFSREIAGSFLKWLADRNQKQVSDEAIELICERLGWLSPYYLERVGEAACELAHGTEVSRVHAEKAADRLLDLNHRTYWATWREHLEKNYPEPERTRLFSILAEACRAPKGTSLDVLLAVLNQGTQTPLTEAGVRSFLDSLEADGYLVAGNANRSQFRFQMNLLREWWLRYVAPSSVSSHV